MNGTNYITSTIRTFGFGANETATSDGASSGKEEANNNILLLVLLPVITLVCVCIAVIGIVWALKRSRMEKLRHHLMPLYSFDPSDSGQDWETDLLSQEVKLRGDNNSPPTSPILKLSTMHSEL